MTRVNLAMEAQEKQAGMMSSLDSHRPGGRATEMPPPTMVAAVYRDFGGPIRIERVATPVAPPGGVLLQVKATGVCRSDWHGWKGHDSDIVDHGLPFVPGHELSGVVVACGAGVTRFREGDRVACPFILSCGACRECSRGRATICEDQAQPGFTMFGSFAEFVSIPRAERNLSALPEAVSFAEAAALGCRTTTAFRAIVQRGQLAAGQTLAVFGCGGVGLSSVLVAVAVGARVIAVDTSAAARAKAEALGACASVDASGSAEATRASVLALTPHGAGADVSVDAAGFASTCEAACWCVRRGGRVVQVGLPLSAPAPQVPMARVANREVEVLGSHGLAADDMPAILAMVASGKLQVRQLIERECSLAEGCKALEAMDTGSPLGITVVTRFHGDGDDNEARNEAEDVDKQEAQRRRSGLSRL